MPISRLVGLTGPLLAAALLLPQLGLAAPFNEGALIIPMDTDYQDEGMFEAFGLVYALLANDVPVVWAIRSGKAFGEADFTASAIDLETAAVVTDHGYRAGPFVVEARYADDALPVITAWQAEHTTAVHRTTTGFEVDVSQYLVAAPTIAMFADGNQDIARGYMQAAGIPDSTGDLGWPDSSPDMLSPEEVAGPTETDHSDGALFDDEGNPVYCQLMSMHWGVRDAERAPEVVYEVREFLYNPVHFFAECQAVNAFENIGHFLTPHGFEIDNLDSGDPLDFFNADSSFAQVDGDYELVGGSERAYTPCGDEACDTPGPYLEGGVVMITGADTGEGIQDVWMTGYIDGACPPEDKDCEVDGQHVGKISYLGGHEYSTRLPISEHPDSVGTRLFLQSLFEAPCATADGQPEVTLAKSGPVETLDGEVTYTLAYANTGFGHANDVVLTDPLPEGAVFVSASDGGVEADGVVTWALGTLLPEARGEVTVTVRVDTIGTSIENVAELAYRVGINHRELLSDAVTTLWDTDDDEDGVGDSRDTCPGVANPAQDLATDPAHCGSCDVACESGVCEDGVCATSGDDVGTDAEDLDATDTQDLDAAAQDTTDEDAAAHDTTGEDVVEDDTSDHDTVDDAAGDDVAEEEDVAEEDDVTAGNDVTEDDDVADDDTTIGDVGDHAGDNPSGSATEEGCGCASARPSTRSTGLFVFLALVGRRRRRT